MALFKTNTAVLILMITIMIMATLCGVSMSAEYKIDLDSAGWITMDDDDYEVPVNLGDSIVMNYDNTKHNLIEVAPQNYDSCNAASPIAKYTSGHDNITFNRAGNYYFICGFPNHCQSGEKIIFMSIQVPPSTSSFGRKTAPENKSK